MVRKRKQNKSAATGICLAVVAVIAAIIAVVASINNGNGISDDFFVSDETKYVIKYDKELLEATSEDQVIPELVYAVYDLDGDEVTGKSSYYLYLDNATATEQVDVLKSELDDWTYTNFEIKGNYVVITFSDEVLEGMTISDVENEASFVESMKQMLIDSGASIEEETMENEIDETSEETTDEASEETTEETFDETSEETSDETTEEIIEEVTEETTE